MVKENAAQPVTFCENYLPWIHELEDLVEAVDFISIHTYPVWEYKTIHEAMVYTKQNYYAVFLDSKCFDKLDSFTIPLK